MNDGMIISRAFKGALTEKERKQLYSIYLKTEYWLTKRHRALVRAKFICEICNIAVACEVHHLTYQRLGAERRGDLLAVCRECHQSEHINPSISVEEHTKKLSAEKRQRSLDKWSKKLGVKL